MRWFLFSHGILTLMEKIIHFKAKLECNIQHAFKMFTDNAMLESWLSTKAEVVPELGGKYELFWDLENKEINSTLGCRVTGIEEKSFISFEWKGPEQFHSFMNNVDPLTHVIVKFTSLKDEQTSVHLFHTGWRNSPEWEEARKFFDNAWKKVMIDLKDKIHKKEL
jgi:uncharacterized protein YndB with AHSA1/START domain